MNHALPGSAIFRRSCIVIWLICISSFATAQLSRPGNPRPLQYEGSKPVEIYEIPIPVEAKSRMTTGDEHPWLKSEEYGYVADVHFDLHNSGVWDTLGDGTKLWRAGFYAKTALAINVVFQDYRVNKGVRIYLYDETQQQILGAFSDLNNKINGWLSTAQIFGDLVIVEVEVPQYLEEAGSLIIAQIGCDLPAMEGETGMKDGWFGLSGACNEDINCYGDPRYQQIKYAVARIVYDGGERCTGSLVNNMLQDGRNYLLTAAHCFQNEQTANTAVFYFDYESPYCGGPDGSTQLSISGATIRARADNMDFMLLELLETVPFYYHPYYAGWNRIDDPPSSGFTIHHPKGDVKKIALEEHPLSEATFSTEFMENSHWLVSHWESGTTESGSSGAAFFDQNDRIAGTLTGGQAECGNSVNDYFQKFSASWDFLSPWLDPDHDVSDAMNGYDPFREFWETGDTLTNINEDELLVIENEGLSWGSLSGHNSAYAAQFAEQFVAEKPYALFGILFHVADNFVAAASSHLTIKVWEGGVIPGALLAEKDIMLADLSANTRQLIQLDSIVSVSDTFFIGYEIYYEHPMDTFSVWMAANRSLARHNTAFIHNGAQWISLTEFTGGTVYSSYDIRPVVYDAEQVPGEENGTGILARVYPNPATDEVWVEFLEMTTAPVKLQLFNLKGQLMAQSDFPSYQTLIRLSTEHVMAGVYILKVRAGKGLFTVKLVILR